MIKRLPLHCILLSFLWLPAGAVLTSGEEGPAAKAPSPPMGWNSFDSYGVYLHEQAALANIDAIAQKLKPYGIDSVPALKVRDVWNEQVATLGRRQDMDQEIGPNDVLFLAFEPRSPEFRQRP
jgi:hypothetical protein